MKQRIDIVDPGTHNVLCQIRAIAFHVADPAVGFTMDDMREVSKQFDRGRFLIERAMASKIERGTDLGGAA